MRRARAARIVQRLNELGVRIEFDGGARAGGGRRDRATARRARHDRRRMGRRFPRRVRPLPRQRTSGVRVEGSPGRRRRHRRSSTAPAAWRSSRIRRTPERANVSRRSSARGSMASRFVIRAIRPRTSARLLALVEHFSLVPSGGSDWHGAAEGPRTLGMMRVPADWLSRQEGRVRARAA